MNACRLAAAVAMAAALAACMKPETRVPLLTLDQSACVASVDLAAAQPVVFNGEPPTAAMIEYNAPCWQPQGGVKTAYALFKLPEAPGPMIVDVVSVPLGPALFSPQAALLDAQGVETRRFAGDRFVFRNDELTIGLRPTPAERYLLVFSNPAVVGQDAGRLMGMVQSNGVYTGSGMVMIYTGSEVNRALTHAHNGKITVAARPVPVAK